MNRTINPAQYRAKYTGTEDRRNIQCDKNNGPVIDLRLYYIPPAPAKGAGQQLGP